MKVKVFVILVFVVILLASAYVKIADEVFLGNEVKSSVDALEDKISIVVSQQNKENAEYRLELDNLRLELNKFKNEKETDALTDMATEDVSEKFLYDIVDGHAIISGYTGSDTYIVIPSHIDGYEVIKIGEGAFAGTKITTLIISEGIREIDWFSFYACPMLTSVTLPKSLSSIGYGAFDGASSKLTIYCYSDSYAHNFAKSYGISHIAA